MDVGIANEEDCQRSVGVSVRAGEWQGWAPTGMLGHRVNGKRLGIIGMGRIGSAVARRAAATGLASQAR